jgi:hypothetical protein
MDQWTSATAGAAIVSPWWLPLVQGVSTVASWALPVLGCAWLVMQMYYKHKEKNARSNETR